MGNVRITSNSQEYYVDQSLEYYPSGVLFDRSTETYRQPYMFGRKELVSMHGLNVYDFNARMQDPVIPRFTSMDPLGEKYPWMSGYAYCMNNPIRYIDPDGRQVAIPIPAPFTPIVFPSDLASNNNFGKQLEQKITRLFEVNKAINELAQIYISYQIYKINNPEYKHQEKRDRKAKEELDLKQLNVAKSINDNISGNLPNGDPAPKRSPKGVKGILIGSGLAAETVKEYIENTKVNDISKSSKEKKNRD